MTLENQHLFEMRIIFPFCSLDNFQACERWSRRVQRACLPGGDWSRQDPPHEDWGQAHGAFLQLQELHALLRHGAEHMKTPPGRKEITRRCILFSHTHETQ